jgi:hypothetical protein
MIDCRTILGRLVSVTDDPVYRDLGGKTILHKLSARYQFDSPLKPDVVSGTVVTDSNGNRREFDTESEAHEAAFLAAEKALQTSS